MKEKYQAASAGMQPEIAFKLADELDYQGEKYAEFQGVKYRILRTYVPPGQSEIEIVLTREVNRNQGAAHVAS